MSVKTSLGNMTRICKDGTLHNVYKIWWYGRFWLNTDPRSLILDFNNTYNQAYTINISVNGSVTGIYLDGTQIYTSSISIPTGVHRVNIIGSNLTINQLSGNEMKACLTNVQFPANTILQTNAFKGCTALQKVTIISSMTTLYDRPFENCTSLTDVYFYPSTTTRTCTSYNNSWFYGCNQNCRLHVRDTFSTSSAQSTFGAWWDAYAGTSNLTRKRLNVINDIHDY